MVSFLLSQDPVQSFRYEEQAVVGFANLRGEGLESQASRFYGLCEVRIDALLGRSRFLVRRALHSYRANYNN
jgi:hypothetical protein